MIEVKEGQIHQILHIVGFRFLCLNLGSLKVSIVKTLRVMLDILQDSPSLHAIYNDETCIGRLMQVFFLWIAGISINSF